MMSGDLVGLRGQRVLIAGGMGFVGSNLAHGCLEQGAEVTVLDCLDPWSGGNPYNIAGIRNDVRVLEQNILNFGGLCRCVVHQDVVFNCAASTSHRFSMRNPVPCSFLLIG